MVDSDAGLNVEARRARRLSREVLQAAEAGDWERAESLLKGADHEWSVETAEQLSHRPRGPFLRTPVGGSWTSDLLETEPGPAGRILMFTGVQGHAGMMIPLLDLYFAELGFGAIYLRDFGLTLYTGGVIGLGGGYEATLEALRARTADAPRVAAMGCSAGGFAALSYGYDMRADTLVGFAGATCLTRAHASPALIKAERRAPRLERMLADQPADRLAIKPRLLSGAYAPAVHLVYGEEMRADRAQAEEAQGLPGVTLHPLAGYGGHHPLGRLARTGALAGFLREAIGV